MHPKLREALREGSISMKAAGVPKFSNKTLRATTVQPSKMARFHNPEKDEGSTRQAAYGSDQMDDPEYQRTSRADESGMPTKDRGATTSPYAKSRGVKAGKGGAGVIGSDTPGRKNIDRFPKTIGKTFPQGATYAGPPTSKTGNTKMKGKQPYRSGGPDGHNARSPRYYGGPPNRRNEGDQ